MNYCEQSSITLDNNHIHYTQKKVEKIKLKSTDILKEATKNSYSNKYLEEQTRTRINKKNCSNTNLKVKFDIKDNAHSNKKNIKVNKKGKINSMDKNTKIELNNNMIEGEGYKKNNTRNLSNHSFNDNYNKDNSNQKFSKTTSQLSLYKNPYINPINEATNRNKILSQEKKMNIINNINDNITIPEIKDLSNKEKACLILAYSKCLRLTERVFFSSSSPKLKEAITKKRILETNKIYLKENLKELEKKINICNKRLASKFNASKTAEITLNFITLTIETDFKLNFLDSLEDETEKKYGFNYVKLLYLVLGENYDEIENKYLTKNLYNKIAEKNYPNIKDYLFHLYIQNKDENKSIENIDKINEIIKVTPDVLNFKVSTKYDKFILYTSVLLNEIIKFGNERFDTMKLIKDCKNLIDIINMKLNLYKRKNQSN